MCLHCGVHSVDSSGKFKHDDVLFNKYTSDPDSSLVSVCSLWTTELLHAEFTAVKLGRMFSCFEKSTLHFLYMSCAIYKVFCKLINEPRKRIKNLPSLHYKVYKVGHNLISWFIHKNYKLKYVSYQTFYLVRPPKYESNQSACTAPNHKCISVQHLDEDKVPKKSKSRMMMCNSD